MDVTRLKISTPETSGQVQFTARRKNNLVRRASQGVKRYKEGKHSDDSSSDVADGDFEYSPVYSQKQKAVDGYSPEASKSGPGSDYSNPFVGDSDSNEDQWLNRKGAGKAQNSKKKKEYPSPKEKKKTGSVQFNQLGTATRGCATDQTSTFQSSISRTSDQMNPPDESATAHPAQEKERCLGSVPSKANAEQENDAELVKGPFADHCPMCDKVIPNRLKRLRHVRTHTKLKCKLCGRIFANQRKLYEHFRNVHLIKKRRVKKHMCNICNWSFSNICNLKEHIESVHKKTKLCLCEICGHTTYSIYIMNNHIRSVHEREKNFKCTICEQAFFLLTRLKDHLKIHTGEKSHQCSLCTKKFSRLSYLKSHLRTHTGERKHKCQICGQGYETLNNLKVHQDISHRKIKPFNCEVCRKCFVTKNKMEMHLRVHTGEKPYECAICKKTFARSSNYGMHMRMHNDVRPYVCTVCDKRFYNASNLKTHVRSHNKKLNG